MKTTPQRRKPQNELHLGRARLRGGSEDDNTGAGSAADIEDDLPHRGRPPKQLSQRDLQISPRSSASRQHSLSPGKYLTPTKRRKRDHLQATQSSSQPSKIQAESFVMKLFDRSLELSKYTEQTSLYPICRAWMANQPRNPSIRSYREQRSPEPTAREDNAADVLAKLQRGEMREVRAMPAPKNAELPAWPTPKWEVTEANTQRLKQLDKVLAEAEGQPEEQQLAGVEDKDTLLVKHLGAWKQIKSNWIKHAKSYQTRYEQNHLIIQELFKP